MFKSLLKNDYIIKLMQSNLNWLTVCYPAMLAGFTGSNLLLSGRETLTGTIGKGAADSLKTQARNTRVSGDQTKNPMVLVSFAQVQYRGWWGETQQWFFICHTPHEYRGGKTSHRKWSAPPTPLSSQHSRDSYKSTFLCSMVYWIGKLSQLV